MKHIPDLKEYHLVNGIVKVKISDLKTEHLYNIIMYWKRNARGGTKERYASGEDGKGNTCCGVWKVKFDALAPLRHVNLLSYIVEYNKRGAGFFDYSSICKEVGGNGFSEIKFVDWDDPYDEYYSQY